MVLVSWYDYLLNGREVHGIGIIDSILFFDAALDSAVAPNRRVVASLL